MTRMNFKDLQEGLTPEEQAEIEAASTMPIVFDEDCPEMTAEMLAQFKKVRQEERTKKTVSLRLSSTTLKKAKEYGKGYTSFLSRLLDLAIQDESMVRKCL